MAALTKHGVQTSQYATSAAKTRNQQCTVKRNLRLDKTENSLCVVVPKNIACRLRVLLGDVAYLDSGAAGTVVTAPARLRLGKPFELWERPTP